MRATRPGMRQVESPQVVPKMPPDVVASNICIGEIGPGGSAAGTYLLFASRLRLDPVENRPFDEQIGRRAHSDRQSQSC